MINSLQLVSLSDFVLSALCLFLAGALFQNLRSQPSSDRMLFYIILFAGLAAFMGGVDHGFFQPIDQRFIPQSLTYVFIAGATFSLLRYTALTFFSGNIQRAFHGLAYVQLVVSVICSFFYHSFLFVVLNYSPVLLLFFAMNLIYIKRGKRELNFSIFCIILIAATLVQVFRIGISEILNGDTLYHIIACVSYLFFYLGAVKH